MTFNFIIILTGVVTGAIGLIGGLIFKRNPPRKINWWYGYRTKRSMRGQEQWDYAQKVAAANMIKYSTIPFLTTLSGFFIDPGQMAWSIAIMFLSPLLWAFLSILSTEKKLKSEFEGKTG